MATLHTLRHPRRRPSTVLDEHLPVDHGLSQVYRVGAGLVGLLLLVFGVLGFTDRVGLFDRGGDTVAGLSTNGALSTVSVVVGLLLCYGMVRGGNFASTLNTVLAVGFLLSGFVNLALLERDANILAFELPNVLFSFAVGLLLLVFGMYGRVSGGLSHDNPYWRARHPDQAAREDRHRARALPGDPRRRPLPPPAARDRRRAGAVPDVRDERGVRGDRDVRGVRRRRGLRG
ncbi:DUF4383 domain-containing protein [Streptomyces phytohabitans]|uniref:DUF4383 domain-containing protein n=1 Tax=Streptomyces phytohabitans TaxID=1150371 RepID=UPI00345BAAC2